MHPPLVPLASGFEFSALYPRRDWTQRRRGTINRFESVDLGTEFAAGLPLPRELERHLEEALRHVLDAPGSLVRPRIVFQMAVAHHIDAAHAKDLAIALEYFHTSSLIFDDLPCMDNGTQRRGAPCVHVAHGEATAILAALALINRAYALSWRAVSGCYPGRQSRAMAYIEERLGVQGLLDGQSRDLHYASLPHDSETNQRIAYGKTVSLIRLSLVLPAMLGGASERELQLLERLSTYWGLSYQIADDLKDLLSDEADSGKTVARDALLDRPNTAVAMGIPSAVKRLNRLIRVGDRTLEQLSLLRPAVFFLNRLRQDLQEEVARVNAHACQMARA
jgi:geranylgeranyl pyrophosphate synthase